MHVSDCSLTEENDICISEVVVLSGVRPAGKTVDQRGNGRLRHGLLYIWEGCVSFAQPERSVLRAGAGTLLYIPKGLRYVMQYLEEGTTFVLVNMQLHTAEGEEMQLCDHVCVLAQDEETRRMANLMAKLEQCSAAENQSAAFRRKELVYRLFSTVFQERIPFETYQPKYANIIPGVLLLQQSYLENIPIAQLAAACSISESSFRGLFTEQYGMSPVQYRNRLRIRRAQSILTDGGCTVTEAAYASGFENIGYFCRYYKKITGETPRETQQNSVYGK